MISPIQLMNNDTTLSPEHQTLIAEFNFSTIQAKFKENVVNHWKLCGYAPNVLFISNNLLIELSKTMPMPSLSTGRSGKNTLWGLQFYSLVDDNIIVVTFIP